MTVLKKLREALVALAAADTEPAVGLVALTGETYPLVWQDRGETGTEARTPRITFFFGPHREHGGGAGLNVPAEFLVVVRKGDGADPLGLAEQIRSRLAEQISFTALAAHSVDAIPRVEGGRDLAGDGAGGLVLNMEFLNAKG